MTDALGFRLKRVSSTKHSLRNPSIEDSWHSTSRALNVSIILSIACVPIPIRCTGGDDMLLIGRVAEA